MTVDFAREARDLLEAGGLDDLPRVRRRPGSTLPISPRPSAGSAAWCSVGEVLLVGFAVDRVGELLVGLRVAHDPRRRVLVAVRGVLDQVLLGELETLGFTAAGLLDGAALLVASPRKVVESGWRTRPSPDCTPRGGARS